MLTSFAGNLSIRPSYRIFPSSNQYKSHLTNYYSGRDTITTTYRRSTYQSSSSGIKRSSFAQSSDPNLQLIGIPQGNQRISRFFRRSVVGTSDIDRVGKALRRKSLKQNQREINVLAMQNNAMTSSNDPLDGNDDENDDVMDIDEDLKSNDESDSEGDDYYYDDDSEDEIEPFDDEAKQKTNRKLQKIKEKYLNNKFSDMERSNRIHSSDDDSDEDDEDVSLSIEDDSSDEEEKAELQQLEERLRIGSRIIAIENLSPRQKEAIVSRLWSMGLISDDLLSPNHANKEEEDLIHAIIRHLIDIHEMLAANDIAHQVTNTARYRYFIKRGYIQYLMTNPFYGHHFTSAMLQPVINLLNNMSEGKKKRPMDVVVAVSPQGFYLLDPIYWQVIFFTNLWDIDDVKIIPAGNTVVLSSNANKSASSSSMNPVHSSDQTGNSAALNLHV